MAKNTKQKTFGGYPVVHATKRDGLTPAAFNKLKDKARFGDEWPTHREGPFWIVTSNQCDNLSVMGDAAVFAGKDGEKNALKYAKACANGNIDHRVLKVVDTTLVVATDNEL